jgi:hypothetical protein
MVQYYRSDNQCSIFLLGVLRNVYTAFSFRPSNNSRELTSLRGPVCTFTFRAKTTDPRAKQQPDAARNNRPAQSPARGGRPGEKGGGTPEAAAARWAGVRPPCGTPVAAAARARVRRPGDPQAPPSRRRRGCFNGGVGRCSRGARCPKHRCHAPNLMAPAAKTLPEATARSEFQNGYVPSGSPGPGGRCVGTRRFV